MNRQIYTTESVEWQPNNDNAYNFVERHTGAEAIKRHPFL